MPHPPNPADTILEVRAKVMRIAEAAGADHPTNLYVGAKEWMQMQYHCLLYANDHWPHFAGLRVFLVHADSHLKVA